MTTFSIGLEMFEIGEELEIRLFYITYDKESGSLEERPSLIEDDRRFITHFAGLEETLGFPIVPSSDKIAVIKVPKVDLLSFFLRYTNSLDKISTLVKAKLKC